MKKCSALLLFPAGGRPALSAPVGGAGWVPLSEVMDMPGDWSQMCAIPPTLPVEAPVPMYSGPLVWPHFGLGEEENNGLQAARQYVVRAGGWVARDGYVQSPEGHARRADRRFQ